MILSPHEIAWLVELFWTDPADQRKGVAVALGESGGETNALARSTTGTNIGQRDHGLFQISGRWNGDKLAAAGSWRDPLTNTRLAYYVFTETAKAKGDGWKAWSVYTSGSYLQYLPDADFGLAFPVKPDGIPASVGDLNVLALALDDVFADVSEIRRHFS